MDIASKDFLELASYQRLSILFNLMESPSKVTMMARKLDATSQEVSRNFDRLVKSGFIIKNEDAFYNLSTLGKSVCEQIPSLVFLSLNKKYFEKHTLDGVPTKFVQRIGSLQKCDNVKGFVKVQEKWKSIYKNSDKYIYNILTEVPYFLDIINPLVDKVKNHGVKINSIFSESALIPEERKRLISDLGFSDLIKNGMIERKMQKSVKVVLLLNEKEACVSFSNSDGEYDLSQAFYGNDADFHNWCYDFFQYYWNTSNAFQETKLKS